MEHNECRESRAIVTLCSNEFMELGKYSHPSFNAYAKRVGADFIVLNEDNRKFSHMDIIFEKFQIGEILNSYNRVLYVDTDAFIKPSCPDIFDIVPYDCFAGTYENAENIPADQHLVDVITKQFGRIGWHQGLMNDGVFVVSDMHKDIFVIPHNAVNKWMWNLYLLNYNVERLKVKRFRLDTKFNSMFVYGYKVKENIDVDAHIIHYAACGGQRPGHLRFLYEKYIDKDGKDQ